MEDSLSVKSVVGVVGKTESQDATAEHAVNRCSRRVIAIDTNQGICSLVQGRLERDDDELDAGLRLRVQVGGYTLDVAVIKSCVDFVKDEKGTRTVRVDRKEKRQGGNRPLPA